MIINVKVTQLTDWITQIVSTRKIRCVTELDSFRGYWRYRSFVIIIIIIIIIIRLLVEMNQETQCFPLPHFITLSFVTYLYPVHRVHLYILWYRYTCIPQLANQYMWHHWHMDWENKGSWIHSFCLQNEYKFHTIQYTSERGSAEKWKHIAFLSIIWFNVSTKDYQYKFEKDTYIIASIKLCTEIK